MQRHFNFYKIDNNYYSNYFLLLFIVQNGKMEELSVSLSRGSNKRSKCDQFIILLHRHAQCTPKKKKYKRKQNLLLRWHIIEKCFKWIVIMNNGGPAVPWNNKKRICFSSFHSLCYCKFYCRFNYFDECFCCSIDSFIRLE